MAKHKPIGIFNRFTSTTSTILGRPWVFVTALVVLVLWGASGPLLGFSNTWQLIINTSTTIITFLMVFIIQNTQNRDNMAMNIKLDVMMQKMGIKAQELLRAEDESDTELEKEKRHVQHTQRKTKKKR